MFANIGDLTSNVISSGKNLPLYCHGDKGQRYPCLVRIGLSFFFVQNSVINKKILISIVGDLIKSSKLFSDEEKISNASWSCKYGIHYDGMLELE